MMSKISVVIHAEEEFDWGKGFYRENNNVTHGKELLQFCHELISAGAKLVVALDYAFLSSTQGFDFVNQLKEKYSEDVEFASHLHPWVTPPFSEDNPVPHNLSFPGNLPYKEELAKLETLTLLITEYTGQRPVTYLAGRYGVGDNTYNILKALGYKYDLSIAAFGDFRDENGPNFLDCGNQITFKNGIKRIPHSAGYVSNYRLISDYINKNPEILTSFRASTIGKLFLKMLGIRRIRLTPEGFSLDQLSDLTLSLLRVKTPHLVFSFHSTSCKTALNPYSVTEKNTLALKRTTLDYLRNDVVKQLKPTLISK